MNELTGSKGCLATDTRSLREIAPLLENYFGITLGYFTNEIESSTGISAAKAIQEDHEIRLPTNRFDYDAYMELFGETSLLTDRLREALLFVAYIITDRKFNEEELYERGYWEDWNTYKGEWAKLMLFMEETEQRHRNCCGDFDILLVPEIVVGNVLGKCLTYTCGGRMAGIVMGCKVPIVLTSRGSSAEEKYYSLAMGAGFVG